MEKYTRVDNFIERDQCFCFAFYPNSRIIYN